MLRQVKAWQAEKRAAIIDLIERTAKAVESDAERGVPVREGELKSKIRIILTAVARELSAVVIADVFYAKFVELGTARAAAHPFMLPAFEANVVSFINDLLRILRS